MDNNSCPVCKLQFSRKDVMMRHYFTHFFTIQLIFLPYFLYLFTIQLIIIPYFPNLFTIQLSFLPCFPYLFTIQDTFLRYCPVCKLQFSRKDVMMRHYFTHFQLSILALFLQIKYESYVRDYVFFFS
jgi:rubredoxin